MQAHTSVTHTCQVAGAQRRNNVSRRRRLQMYAAAANAVEQSQVAAPPARPSGPLVDIVEALFKFPPFFSFASKKARAMIVKRGKKMGLDFEAEIAHLQGVDWAAELAAVEDKSVKYPDYYTVPFHAYPEGNLGWTPAMEMTVAARSVHSTVYADDGKTLDPEGDNNLRSSYSRCMQQLLEEQQAARPVQQILDVGASTGLSSLALLAAFPAAEVTGVDLSPHMLAVGSYLQRQRQQQRAAAGQPPEQLRFVHAAGEDTRLPDESVDLVSVMLVCHELPAAASQAVFKEAHRVLRPGGALAVMEMNPASPGFRRIFANPFPYVAFKSTEPWLLEYLGLDMAGAMRAAGFSSVKELENSPRHETVVAVKSS
ncbi:Demethylmenaquinone methyltransferase [Chlorella vulgaris]